MRLRNTLLSLAVAALAACVQERIPAQVNGLDGHLLFTGDFEALAVGDSYGLSVEHELSCTVSSIDLGKGHPGPLGCADDLEVVSASCEGCTVAVVPSSERTVGLLQVQASAPGTATLTVRVRRTSAPALSGLTVGQTWDDRVQLEWVQPTAIRIDGTPTAGRAFLPGATLWLTPQLVAGDRPLHHRFGSAQVVGSGQVTVDASWMDAAGGAAEVRVDGAGPSTVAFSALGLSGEVQLAGVAASALAGFELREAVGLSEDPLTGASLPEVVVPADAVQVQVTAIGLLADGTPVIGAGGLASSTDPRLKVTGDESTVSLEVDRSQPAGDGLLTLSSPSARVDIPVRVQ